MTGGSANRLAAALASSTWTCTKCCRIRTLNLNRQSCGASNQWDEAEPLRQGERQIAGLHKSDTTLTMGHNGYKIAIHPRGVSGQDGLLTYSRSIKSHGIDRSKPKRGCDRLCIISAGCIKSQLVASKVSVNRP